MEDHLDRHRASPGSQGPRSLRYRRRRLLGTGAALLAAFAGCAVPGGDGGDGTTPAGTGTTSVETTQPGSTPAGTTTAPGPTTAPGTTREPTTGTASVPGDRYPAIDDWLTETEVGGPDDTYDGTLADRRGADSLEVAVGAPGNGDSLAFAPSAVVVSTGTTVRWVWTGEGGVHNVVADRDSQAASDDEFRSGDPTAEAGTTYERTLPDPGVALYHCGPHLSLGMKGGVAVAAPN